MRSTPIVLGLFGALAVAAAPAGPMPYFQGLGFLPGGGESFAFDVAPDGAAVVGRSRLTDDDREAFLWTPAAGMIGLGDLPGGAHRSSGQGVSAGGGAVAGLGAVGSGWDHAFRWTQADGMVDLGDLPGGVTYSIAYDISSDGTVVVGTGTGVTGAASEAFRWTTDEGMIGLGTLPAYTSSTASAVSADGRAVVGSSQGGSERQAYRWTADEGMVGLGDLPGGAWPMESLAKGVSVNGSVVVGTGESTAGMEAFRWTEETGMASLGDLPGSYVYAVAWDTNADGSLIIGRGSTDLGEEAFIWDAQNGMRNLRTLLQTEYGLDLTGWQLNKARGISDDGRVIAGYGTNPSGQTEAWVAFIPEPRSLLLSLIGVGAYGIARRRS
jgi:probable HAF family extracellular repeat protein